MGVVTLVPRPCAVRQALEAWGQPHPPLPRLGEKPGRTKDEAPRRWHGHSVRRQGEVEDSAGRVAPEEGRLVVVHARQLAQQHAQTSGGAQAQDAETLADPVRQVHARWCACLSDAAAAIADYAGRGPGRRGRQPRPWRYHAVR